MTDEQAGKIIPVIIQLCQKWLEVDESPSDGVVSYQRLKVAIRDIVEDGLREEK